jgi:NADPH-dependent ferric siderophore reductase
MTSIRTRREPPRFRRVTVARVEIRSPYLRRITLAGRELEGLDPGLPAASVRLLLPDRTTGAVAIPVWNGNEFLAADGSRPSIRTLTPLRFDPAGPSLDVDIVDHGSGPLSEWSTTATNGDEGAVSGTGRGYTVDAEARSFLLAGDEAALPAISALLPALPSAAVVDVVVEVRHPEARVGLPAHPGARVTWLDLPSGATSGQALVAAIVGRSVPADARVWAAGEAAAMQRLRRHLFEDRSLARAQTVVRGYWKQDRAGDAGEA